MGLTRYTWRTFSRETGLIVLAVLWCLPFVILIEMSLKPTYEALTEPLALPKSINWSNYSLAWHGGSQPLGTSIVNSLVITLTAVVLITAIAAPAAYAIARRGGRVSTIVYLAFIIAYILPHQLAVIPAYVVLQHFHLTGSYVGVIFLFVAVMLPLAVFLYVGSIRALPQDYEEAAQLDGASVSRTFWQVVFPLLRPVTGTVAVLTGLILWNDFFVAVIFLGGTARQTLPVAIYTYAGEQEGQWNTIFASIAISMIPVLILFAFAQRQLIRGFSGGIKS